MSLVPDAEPAEPTEEKVFAFELHLHSYDEETGPESITFDMGDEPAIILTPGREGVFEMHMMLSRTTREEAADLLKVALQALENGEESEYIGNNSEEA